MKSLMLILACSVISCFGQYPKNIVVAKTSVTAPIPPTFALTLLGTNAVLGSDAVLTNGLTTITIGSVASTTGSVVIVFFAQDPQTAQTPSCADSKGNTYSTDVSLANGTLGTGARAIIFSAPITNALTTSDVITVTGKTGAVARALSVYSVTGINVSGSPTRVDKTASATGGATTTTPSSGPTALTDTPDELIIGLLAIESRVTSSPFTQDAPFILLQRSTADSGSVGSSMTAYPAYYIASSTNVFTYSGSIESSAKGCATCIATYRKVP